MKMKHTAVLLATTVACSTVFGAEADQKKTYTSEDSKKAEFKQAAPQVEPAESNEFKWGGDIRLRTIYFDNIPYANNIPGVGTEARGGANSFQRYRTRVFGEYHPRDDLYFRGRLVNEFRTYQTPDNQSWSAMDETVFDNLFVDYKNDLFDVRVGRQDMIYGTGKLILDGTPKDGSRTIYFDAAKASYKGIENTTVDVLGMYTYAQDKLAIHSQGRDIVGMTGGTYTGAEAGGAVYVKNKSYEDLPWEAYYIAKTKGMEITDRLNTVGTRLMPKTAEGVVDGNLEIAYQSAPGVSEFMIDALASWHIEGMEEQKACLGAGWYHLSEDWNPLFARWPQYSELFVYSFDTTGAGQWKNVSMPHIDFSISPCKSLKSDLLLGYMFAPTADGLGGGNNRGLLFTWWNRFTIKEKMLSDRDKLTGHFLFELVQPGDYYNDEQQDNTATFLRLELSYAF
jgi:hypothetical protein